MSSQKSPHYQRSGVDIDAADSMIERIKPLAASTRVPGATGGLGGFGGVFDLAAAGFGAGSPRLVSGTDGVGTKLKLAFATGVHSTVGIDCVAMCVNDILAAGARPLFFLDYFATGRLDPAVGAAVVEGIAEGCRQASCWLAGGETAEMPGMYPDGEYDLAGFVVGAVRPDEELTPEMTRHGDVVIGIGSSGVHSNGFSLVRRVLLDEAGLPLDAPLAGDTLPLGRRLLTPTRIYVRALDALRSAGVAYRGVAHITGGGLWENPQRSVDAALAVRFDVAAVRSFRQPVFGAISALGAVPERELYRVFNMGIGMTLCVSPDDADRAIAALVAAGETASVVGELVVREGAAVRIDGVSDSPLDAV
ncbi:MAG: phosphoribosylformylglycinamidine cyclo-ligase [Myxococcales bacterium]|nr:phosphoribosylformylglycinamidine cyclo-ligase [Myxococcales bacterium]